jgi:methyl-accepting chemotaxis protein
LIFSFSGGFVQTDAIANQLDRIGDIQMVMAIATSILALFALAIAAAALLVVWKVKKAMSRGLDALPAKTDPLIAAVTRVAENARDVSDTAKVRVKDILSTLEEISERLKAGADSVEDRVKRFGAVVDVVQAEAEDLLLDAASTARGVHTAAEVLRDKKKPRTRLPAADEDLDEDVFDK